MATCRMRKWNNLIALLQAELTDLSEIPCRVSNIAQGSGDTTQMTGSNRWNPNDACTGASRAIPRVRFETGVWTPPRFPVTTQGVRPLDGLDSYSITRRL